MDTSHVPGASTTFLPFSPKTRGPGVGSCAVESASDGSICGFLFCGTTWEEEEEEAAEATGRCTGSGSVGPAIKLAGWSFERRVGVLFFAVGCVQEECDEVSEVCFDPLALDEWGDGSVVEGGTFSELESTKKIVATIPQQLGTVVFYCADV